MSFAKNDRRRFDPDRAPRFALPRRPTVQFVRVVFLALLAAAGAVWAIAYHYTVTLPPMLKPAAAAPSATYDPDAGEMPVPEIETSP